MKPTVLIFLVLLLTSLSAWGQEIPRDLDIHHTLIENKGQWPKGVLFQSQQAGGNLWVHERKMVYHLRDLSKVHARHHGGKASGEIDIPQTVVHANFKGAVSPKSIEKSKPSSNEFNYFLGNDRSRWSSGVKGFQEVTLTELYPNIDLALFQGKLKLKYEFVVKPEGQPDAIQIEYVGQEKIKIDAKGRLVLQTALGQIIEEKPRAYQIINGKIVDVPCAFVLEGNVMSFELGKYRKDKPLVIDPELVFATYCGSPTDNFGMTATFGHDGTAYSGGTIFGNAYPTPDPGAYDVNSNFTTANNGTGTTDVFVSKYSADGTQMLWTTFLGGGNDNGGTETVHSLICDLNDNVYLYGVTSSIDFPMVNPAQATHEGGSSLNVGNTGANFGVNGTDIFVAKFSSDGSTLMGSTYIGGSANDGVNYLISGQSVNDSLAMNYGDHFRGEIMLGANNEIIVATSTRSQNFPTVNPIQATLGGKQDGVVFALSNDCSSILFSTFFGGTENDACYSVKVDSSFNIVFAGGTFSSNLQGTNGRYQPNYAGGMADGFIGKLSPDGTNLIGATYLGTGNYDQVYFVEVDRNNKIFALGQSRGGDFPVVNAAYSNANSNHFIAKLDSNLTVLENSTVIGRSNTQDLMSPSAFLIDRCGLIYVSGWGADLGTSSPLAEFPTTDDAFMENPTNSTDFYLFVMDRNFDDIIYGSFIGGPQADEHVDGGTSRFDRNGIVYQSVCAGCGGLSDFQTTQNAWSGTNQSPNCNNLVFKFDFQLSTKAEFTFSDTLACTNVPVQLVNNANTYTSFYWVLGDGDTSYVFEPTVQFDTPGTYVIKLIVTDSVCLDVDTAQITVTIGENFDLDIPDDIFYCNAVDSLLTADTQGAADSVIWSTNIQFSDTLNNPGIDSFFVANVTSDTVFYVFAKDGECRRIDSVRFINVITALQLDDTVSICLPETAFAQVSLVDPSISFEYMWSPVANIAGPTNTDAVSILSDTSLYVYVTANYQNQCEITDSIFVDVHELPDPSIVVTAEPDTLPKGGTTSLNALPNGYSYAWQPSDEMDNPTAQSTTAKVDQNKSFTVTISDGVCSKSASVEVFVYDFVCDRPGVYVPNAFSPNGDGENDVLYVRGPVISEFVFRVFNRWGQLMFESTNQNVGWDGTYKGKLVDPDTYDYYLDVICVDGQENLLKGNITLLR